MCCFRLHFSNFNVLLKKTCCSLLLKKITCCAKKREKITCREEKAQPPTAYQMVRPLYDSKFARCQLSLTCVRQNKITYTSNM